MAIELTREDLFTQVWKRPMTKVAAQYGISDVALKKIRGGPGNPDRVLSWSLS